MTVLDKLINASSKPQISDEPLKYPLPLPADLILSTLKTDPINPNPNSFSQLNPLSVLKISSIDSTLIDLNTDFFKKLNQDLKSSQKSLDSSQFIEIFNRLLEDIVAIKFGGSGYLEMGNDFDNYSCNLIEKVGNFIGRDVIGLVIEWCCLVENWKILQTLIENNLVDYEYRSDLLSNLVAKKRSDLICLCVKKYKDMKGGDLRRLLRYFLSPSKEAVVTMCERKEWESEALLAITKAGDKMSSGKNVGVEKDAALLLMIAYDGFSSWELCLHYLVSCSVDDVVFSSAISELNVEEMLGLIRYLGKWLRKYERFPQVGPCPDAVIMLGLKLPQWVPKVEDVVKCLGLVVDVHFTSLAMHSEFRNEVNAVEEVVRTLGLEGRLCSSVVNVIDILKPKHVTA